MVAPRSPSWGVDMAWMEDGQIPMSLGERFDNEPESPELGDWDVILINTSGGKDSQAMLGELARLAAEAGVPKRRLVAVHAELGRVEWSGTLELAREQAEAYGVEFRSVRRPQGDLLDHVEKRGMWPGPATRYCTSDHKRGQIAKVITALDRERRTGGRFSLLNCMGLRAEESSARRKQAPYRRNKHFSTQTRTVYDWLPIHRWSERRVWAAISESGVRHHPAYDLGMPRLSCCFCIFAPREALVLAGRHNTELLDEYVAVEERIGHRFRVDLSLAEVRGDVERAAEIGPITGKWNM